MVDEPEAGIDCQNFGQGQSRIEHDYTSFIEIRVRLVGRECGLGVIEKLVEFITVQIIAAIDSDRELR